MVYIFDLILMDRSAKFPILSSKELCIYATTNDGLQLRSMQLPDLPFLQGKEAQAQFNERGVAAELARLEQDLVVMVT